MKTSDSRTWEERMKKNEHLTTVEGCIHLKESALDLSICLDQEDHFSNYAQKISSHISRAFTINGFPDRLIKASFSGFEIRNESDKKVKDRLLSYCEGIAIEESKRFTPSFGMYGPPGTGKTFAAVCVAKEFAWLGASCAYTTVSALAREVRATFSRDAKGSEASILEKYVKKSILIMDEIGSGTGSDHERAMFTDVISERYNAKRPTILISNLNIIDFKLALGERVTDRMSEDGGFILPVLGESRRRT